MEIRVRVVTGARKEHIEKHDERTYDISIREKPKEGRANARIKEVVARMFGVGAEKVHILRGLRARTKFIRIDR